MYTTAIISIAAKIQANQWSKAGVSKPICAVTLQATVTATTKQTAEKVAASWYFCRYNNISRRMHKNTISTPRKIVIHISSPSQKSFFRYHDQLKPMVKKDKQSGDQGYSHKWLVSNKLCITSHCNRRLDCRMRIVILNCNVAEGELEDILHFRI